MSYKPAASGIPNGIVFFGTPAGDNVFEAESNFAYNPSTDTLSVDNISAATANLSGDLTVNGDLNVSGVVNQVNSTNLLVEDVTITLRNGFAGTPSSSDDASIIVNRGSSDDALITWDEDELLWTFDYGSGVPLGIREHVKGGQGITEDDTSKPYRTLNFSIADLTETATSASDNDLIAIYDSTGSATKKITRGNFISGLGGGTVTSVGVSSDTIAVSGSPITSNGTIDLEVKVDSTTITHNGSNELKIVDGGVDTTQLADGAVTEAKRERTVATPSSNSSSLSDINLVTTGSSDLTMTLPSSPSDGQIVTVKKIDSGSGEVIISAGTDTVDGAVAKRLYYQYESLTCVAQSGTPNAWHII